MKSVNYGNNHAPSKQRVTGSNPVGIATLKPATVLAFRLNQGSEKNPSYLHLNTSKTAFIFGVSVEKPWSPLCPHCGALICACGLGGE